MPTSSGGSGRASPQVGLEKILSAPFEGPVALIFGGWPNDDGVAEYRDVPMRASLKTDLTGLIETWRLKVRRRHGDEPPREYDSAPQPEDAQGVQFIRLAMDDHLRRAVQAEADPTDLREWTPEDPEVGQPRSFVIAVKLRGGGTARFFRRLTASKELRRPGKVVAFLEGSRFKSLEEARVILLEDSFDCAEYGGDLFILNASGFEALFEYETSISHHASEAIDGVQSFIEPARLSELRQHVSSNRVHMRRLAGRIRIDLASVDIEAVRTTVAEFGFNISVREVDGRIRLGFDHCDPRDLVRLLTDAAVRSAITGQKFIATAKTVV